MARNPFRSEAEAYRFLLLTVGYFALIVVAAAIATWLGLVVFVVLTAIAIGFWIRSRSNEPALKASVPQVGSEDERRILVIANETVGGESCYDPAQQGGGRAGADPRRLPGAQLRGQHWASTRTVLARPRRTGSTRASPARVDGVQRRARSATATRSRRWRTRCAPSARTRS